MDRTSVTAVVHSCPPERVSVIVGVLEEYGLHFEAAPYQVRPDGDDRAVVRVGERYSTPETPVGSAEELANGLIQVAPDIAFTVHEDPAYEYLGTVFCHVPDLGLFTSDCDAVGTPYFSQGDVLALEQASSAMRRRMLGVPWLEATEEMPECTVFEVEMNEVPSPE